MKKIKITEKEYIGNMRHHENIKSLITRIHEGEESQQDHRRKQLQTKERHTHRDVRIIENTK